MDAVDQRTITRQCGRYNWGVEAESTGGFDHIDHAWMSRMWAARRDDRALWRLIQRWLKAGVRDTEGKVLQPATGPPHGGIRAPILAHGYLHDALDLWCETGGKRRCRGEACLIRYADDLVCALAHQAEADRFSAARGQRLGQCGLARSAEQTRVIPFSRQRPAEKTSFEVWGVEFRWGKDRAGKDPRGRRTSRKKLRNSRTRFTPGGQQNRPLRRRRLCAGLKAKRRGYDNDYGVHGHFASLKQFFSSAMGILKQGLNRRSQRRRYPWAGDKERLARLRIERPRIVGRPQPRVAASTA